MVATSVPLDIFDLQDFTPTLPPSRGREFVMRPLYPVQAVAPAGWGTSVVGLLAAAYWRMPMRPAR